MDSKIYQSTRIWYPTTDTKQIF